MKALRIVGGFLAGYAISLGSSLVWFLATHHLPQLPQPLWFVVATALYGILFAILAGYVAAILGGYATGFAVGVAIAIASIFSLLTDRGAHWSQYIALVLMAPATVLGAKLWARKFAVARRRSGD